MTRSTLAGMALLVVCAMMATGCTTVAKETYSRVTGAKGSYVELTSLGAEGATPLEKYNAFEIASVTDNFNGMVPQELINNLPMKFEEILLDKKLPATGSPTCRINVDVFYYEGSGSMGIVLGDVEEVLAYVTLIDGSTGSQIAKGICVGRTTSRFNLGVDNKTEGLAKAIVKWIEERSPEPTD